MNWINIKDILPPNKTRHLSFDGANSHISVYGNDGFEHSSCDANCPVKNEITHWMPMPSDPDDTPCIKCNFDNEDHRDSNDPYVRKFRTLNWGVFYACSYCTDHFDGEYRKVNEKWLNSVKNPVVETNRLINCPWCRDFYQAFSFMDHLEVKKCYLED